MSVSVGNASINIMLSEIITNFGVGNEFVISVKVEKCFAPGQTQQILVLISSKFDFALGMESESYLRSGVGGSDSHQT